MVIKSIGKFFGTRFNGVLYLAATREELIAKVLEVVKG